ncbi:MAG: PAS domain-containing protein [Pseudomonadales bacterium]
MNEAIGQSADELHRTIADQQLTIHRLEQELQAARSTGCQHDAAEFDSSLDLQGIAGISGGPWTCVNSALCRALGWSKAELYAMSLLDMTHPDDVQQTAARLAGGEPLMGVEHRVRCKNGGYLRIAWNLVPHLAEGVTCYSGRDMTARTGADELLSAQNQALEAVAAPIPLEQALAVLAEIVEQQSGRSAVAAIMLVDADTASLRSGVGPGLPAWYHEALEGVAIAEGVGACAWAAACNAVIVTPDIANAPSWQGLSHLPLSLGLKGAWSMPIRGSDGRVLGTFGTYFKDCRSPTPWERQLVEGLCHSAGWAIERQQAEAALRNSEERFRNATEAGDVGTWRVELDTGLDTRDASLNRLLGLEAQDSVCPVEDFLSRVHRDDRPQVEAALQQAAEGAGIFDVEARILRPGGEERWIRDRGRIVRGAAGQPLYLTGAAVDITDRVHAEQRLRDEDQHKDQFLAVLGHELRTPLAPLRTGLEVLGAAGVADEAAVQVRTMMGRQVDHLVRLVDDLLDLSRISRGTISLQRAQFDLDAVIDRAVELARPLIVERGHEVVVERAGVPLPIDGDLERLTQVTANLLTNAAKYMDRGGTIRLTTRRDGGEAFVAVADHGYGIPLERLPNLFKMFSQVPEHRGMTGGGGLGIGLALSRQLVEMHGGSIGATSQGLRCGSEFRFRLPLTAAPVTSEAAEVAARAAERSRRVLVVDDNVDAAETLGLVLECNGSVVHVVHDGPGALRAFERFAPEIVLLDIGLPGMDGYEVARRLRAMPGGRNITLCAITGWGQEGDKLRAQAAGFDQHLTKPVSAAQLAALITADQRN